MDNILSDLSEKAAEQLEHTGKAARAAIKGIGQSAKGQVVGSTRGQVKEEGTQEKVDTAVTGKPIPSKKVLAKLSQATAQLQAAKLKKIREELARQRLKTSQTSQTPKMGPEVPVEKPKPKEDIVAKTLKGSKSTGEFKGLIGG